MTGRESCVAGLQRFLLDSANASGGWGYYPGKRSRLEPSCWALLALGTPESRHVRFLESCQGSDGLLREDRDWPANVAFNALAALALGATATLGAADRVDRVLHGLTGLTGITVSQELDPINRQNDQLQAWPWVDATFSWVEPTGWALLALKKLTRRAPTAQIRARIADADAVLFDRACDEGGWNYGNSNMLGQRLWPYVPTTALGLLALRDRHPHPATKRALAFLEHNWPSERSGPRVLGAHRD